LADQAEKEAAGQVDEECALGKGAGHADLHEALKAVTRERADSPKDSNQNETQSVSILQTAASISSWLTNKKLLEPRASKASRQACQESSESLKEQRPGYGELHRLEMWP